MACLKWFRSAHILALVVIAGGYQTAKANTYWSFNPSTADDWFDSFAWSGGVPNNNQSAYIANGGTATISYGSAVAEGVYVGAQNNSSSGTLVLTGGQLNCGNYSFWVGNSSGFSGSEGLVNQSGGAAIASNLYIADNVYSSGTYELSGTGQLEVTGSETIGYYAQNNPGVGQFIQSGGTNSASGLTLTEGTYSMTGASTLNTNQLIVGGNGAISGFTQSGGSVSVGTSGLTLGSYGQCSYSISNGGMLTVNSSKIVIGGNGSGCTGVFNQTDSTCNFGAASVYIGDGNNCMGVYNLAGNSQLYAGNEYVGYSTRATFTQTGGTNNLGTNTLYVNYESESATYTISGNSFLFSGDEYIGYNPGSAGSAAFIQYGGVNNLGNFSLYVGTANATASYSLFTGGMLMARNEYVGATMSAVFTQSGGNNSCQTLSIANGSNNSSLTGSYFLSGGTTTAAMETVGNSGYNALFDQTGGANIVGTMTISASGRYDLLGGILQITNTLSNSGTFDLQNPAGAGLAGTNNLTLAPLPITGAGTLIVEQNAALYSASITQGSLILGGKIQIAPGSQVSKINSLDITTGTFDITNNALIIDYPTTGPSPLSSIQDYIHTGYENGWSAGGIISSTAAGRAGVGIGYAEVSALGITNIGNVTLDNTDVLVRYTWAGDANLDGIVNSADLAMIQSNGSTWFAGDFNYDGVVNADDYALFQLGMAESGGNMISVPEAEIIWAGLLIPLIFQRRNKRG